MVPEVDTYYHFHSLEGAHFHKATFTLGDYCMNFIVTVSLTFTSQVLGLHHFKFGFWKTLLTIIFLCVGPYIFSMVCSVFMCV
jgi:uncharacterized membrane protein